MERWREREPSFHRRARLARAWAPGRRARPHRTHTACASLGPSSAFITTTLQIPHSQVLFSFPPDRLPARTQLLLASAQGRAVLASWPQYAGRLVAPSVGGGGGGGRSGDGGPSTATTTAGNAAPATPRGVGVYLGVWGYFCHWLAFFAGSASGASGGSGGGSGAPGFGTLPSTTTAPHHHGVAGGLGAMVDFLTGPATDGPGGAGGAAGPAPPGAPAPPGGGGGIPPAAAAADAAAWARGAPLADAASGAPPPPPPPGAGGELARKGDGGPSGDGGKESLASAFGAGASKALGAAFGAAVGGAGAAAGAAADARAAAGCPPFQALLASLLEAYLPHHPRAAHGFGGAAASAWAGGGGASTMTPGLFGTPPSTPPATSAAARQGAVLASTLIEFWLADPDLPFPGGASGGGGGGGGHDAWGEGRGQAAGGAPQPATALRSFPFEPPGPELAAALTTLALYVTAEPAPQPALLAALGGDGRGGWRRRPGSSPGSGRAADNPPPTPALVLPPWLPALPPAPAPPPGSLTAAAAAGAVVPGAPPHAPPRLGPAAGPGPQALGRAVYRYLRRGLSAWPASRPLDPLLDLWLAAAAPWVAVAGGGGGGGGGSGDAKRRSSAGGVGSGDGGSGGGGGGTARGVLSRLGAAVGAGGSSTPSLSLASPPPGAASFDADAWSPHVAATLPLWSGVLPALARLAASRAAAGGGPAALGELSRALAVLGGSPGLDRLLAGLEGAAEAAAGATAAAAAAAAQAHAGGHGFGGGPAGLGGSGRWRSGSFALPTSASATAAGGSESVDDIGPWLLAQAAEWEVAAAASAAAGSGGGGPDPAGAAAALLLSRGAAPAWGGGVMGRGPSSATAAIADALAAAAEELARCPPARRAAAAHAAAALAACAEVARIALPAEAGAALDAATGGPAGDGRAAHRRSGWSSDEGGDATLAAGGTTTRLRRARPGEIAFSGDWARRPVGSNEWAPAVRALLALSDWINGRLGLVPAPPGSPTPWTAAWPPASAASAALARRGARLNLRPAGELQTLAWAPILWYGTKLVLTVLRVFWAVLTEPVFEDDGSGGV